MGWADKLAARSSHPSARAYARPNPGAQGGVGRDGVRSDDARKRAQDAWGVRYGGEVGGISHHNETIELHGEQVNFAELNSLKPGTPEFTARYIPPAEEVETLAPYGEGIAVVARGETTLEIPERVPLDGVTPPREVYETMNGR